jgi:mannose-6-phosphate isomerase-like protein (cupin superfamily)
VTSCVRYQPAPGVCPAPRAADRMAFPNRAGARQPAYRFECLEYPATDRLLNAYFVRFDAGAAELAEPHQHDGAEIVFVTSGSLGITVGAEEHVLHEGDSIYFDPSPEHSYRRVGKEMCTAVVVTTA